MDYAIGDTVFHWTHGVGKVVAIDEKLLAGKAKKYYVVEAGLLTLWVPAEEGSQDTLRLPADRVEFQQHIDSLQAPGVQLSDNPYKRKLELRDRIQKRTLASLCSLIRDLADRSSQYTLNENDVEVLSKAEEYLLDEWVLSLDTERESAREELEVLMQRDTSGKEEKAVKWKSKY